MENYMLPCLNKRLFGFDCMGCGIQRSLHLIFQGEFLEAFYMYPAIYSLIALFFTIGINIFFKFKKSNIIIGGLSILTVATIVTSYIIKITI